jgi:medium-chain acyl-[acyl-carrier-protein] hydrolase
MSEVSMASRIQDVPAYLKWTGRNSIKADSKPRLRLFCFPYAGGGSSIFREWADDLPSAIEVRPIQLPGRENRWGETPFTSLSPLVEALSSALDPLLDLPSVFFGHSMGAFISFELARQLRRKANKTPIHLFISGARAPQIPDPDPPIHQLPDAAFIKELQRLNGIPEKVLQDAELMRLVMPTLRADLTLCETFEYSPDEPLRCPITAYGGQQDKKAPRELLAGWSAQTSSAFTLRAFPGDHFYLTSARKLLLHAVSAELSGILMRMDR